MSKGLDALASLCNQCEFYQFEKGLKPKKCPFNKNCVYRTRIEKELKALEIMRKLFDKPLLPYEDLHVDDQAKITKEEYDLLKEVLL